MTEDTDDGSIDYPAQYAESVEERKQLVAKLQNHLHVLMSSALSAAENIHVTSCNIGHHHAQTYLSNAMHSNLIAAGVIRQALDDLRAVQ